MLNLRAFEIKRPTSRAVWWFRSTGVGEEEEEEVERSAKRARLCILVDCRLNPVNKDAEGATDGEDGWKEEMHFRIQEWSGRKGNK
jgi:hypothetical protein